MARDVTRDVVRGLTSLEMTFVNVSGLPATAHSGYIGQITYADTIFPCFAFLAGMSPAPTRRNIGLMGVGLGLNAVAAAASGKPFVRLPGVLQRLGLAGIVANHPGLEALRQLHGLPLALAWYAVSLLGAARDSAANPLAHPGYPAADADGTAQTRLDKFVFGQSLYTPSHDPEGLLGALTTAISMLLGRAFEQSGLPVLQKALAAVGSIVAGQSLHFLLPKYAPISKSLWTPSFVLVTSGVSALKYLAVGAAVPYLPTAVQNLLSAVGKRSLEVYVVSTLLTILLKRGGQESLHNRGARLVGNLAGPAAGDFAMSLGLTAAVAASAEIMVAQNWRIRW